MGTFFKAMLMNRLSDGTELRYFPVQKLCSNYYVSLTAKCHKTNAFLSLNLNSPYVVFTPCGYALSC